MYHLKDIPLLWNKLQIIQLNIDFIVEIQTYSLSMISLNENRESRLNLIYKLHNDGWSNNDISNYLNHNNILTPKGLRYYPKLIWTTLFKYKRRLERNNNYRIVDIKEKVWVELN